MFRGGPVDSRGTGITSGLMDSGRVGYEKGNLVLGGDLYTKDDYSNFMKNYADNLNKNSALYKSIFTTNDDGEVVIDEGSKYSYENMFGKATGDTVDKEGKFVGESIFTNVDPLLDPTSGLLPPPGGTQALGEAMKADILKDLKASKQFEPVYEGGGKDAAQYGVKPEDPNNNNDPSNTEISAKDLIKENAELFKELLGEGQEERIKKARIQDVSDLGLDIFAQSQKEGATVGSTLGGAAEKLVGKDTRVDKAIAAGDKINQTGTVLAINDYIAGKRSKESTDQLIAKLTLGASLKKGSLGQAFADFRAQQGTLGTTDMEIIIKGRFPGRQTEVIPAGAGEYEPSPDGSDEGKFYIEEDTKDVYEVVNGKKIKRF
tara:strand:+ start:34 stop:1158 length:1125 start_codon:yes stop_codon:yes gene_type:complete